MCAGPPSAPGNVVIWGAEPAAGRPGHAAYQLFRFGGQRLGLGNPGIGAARKTNLFTDLMRGIVVEFGELPVVEDAEVVEFLLDRTRYAGELLEVVGGAARTGQTLEAGRLGSCRNFLAGRLSGGADVDAVVTLGARDAVDGGAGNQVAIQRNGAASVVVARHHIGDALGVRVGIDDRGDGNVEPLRFLDRDVFLVGVDHEDHVGKPAHVLDATQRTVELVALALQGQPLLLGVGVGFAAREHFVEVTQALDRARNRLPVGQRAAEPARIDEVLCRTLRSLGDAVLRLALGADEQDTAALGDGVTDRLQRRVQQRNGLGEIDDVNVVAGAENVLCHFRIPAVRLVAKVNAGFEQLAHRKIGYRHRFNSPVGSSGSV